MTSIRRAPLVRRGTPQAHALSVASRVRTLQTTAARARRRIEAEYGREADPMTTLLLGRLEQRLEDLGVTADTLMEHLMMHAPAPRDDTDGAWLCLNPSCGRPLYGLKSTAKCCSNVCRAEVSRLKASGAREWVDPHGALRLILPTETMPAGHALEAPV
jgi:hypothetical protein